MQIKYASQHTVYQHLFLCDHQSFVLQCTSSLVLHCGFSIDHT